MSDVPSEERRGWWQRVGYVYVVGKPTRVVLERTGPLLVEGGVGDQPPPPALSPSPDSRTHPR